MTYVMIHLRILFCLFLFLLSPLPFDPRDTVHSIVITYSKYRRSDRVTRFLVSFIWRSSRLRTYASYSIFNFEATYDSVHCGVWCCTSSRENEYLTLAAESIAERGWAAKATSRRPMAPLAAQVLPR